MNKIHRIWMGGPMPEKFVQFGREWQELNKAFELKDWTEEEIFDTIWDNQSVIDKMVQESKRDGADKIAFYTHVADVICYEIIYRHGGWYFNTDLKPIKPLGAIDYGDGECVFAHEDPQHLVNMAFYAPPGHPFLKRIIERLPERYWSAPGAFMNYSTGVMLIHDALQRYMGPVKRLGPKVFNPVHFTGFSYGEELDYEGAVTYPETVAIHGWHHRTSQRGQRILESGW